MTSNTKISKSNIKNKENTSLKENLKEKDKQNNINSIKSEVLSEHKSNQNNLVEKELTKTPKNSNSVINETTNKTNNKSTRSSKSVNIKTKKNSRSSKSVEDDDENTLKWEEVSRGKSAGLKKFKCTAQLMEWANKGNIRSELQQRNTEALKVICEENNLLRSGPKYELISRLIENAEKGIRKKLDNKLKEEAEAGNKSSEIELTFSKFKSFEASMNHARKMIQKMGDLENSKFNEKLDYLIGISKGVDSQLLVAITGPKCGKYNGKYDEIGIEGNSEIAHEWLRFLKKRNEIGLTLEELDQFIKAADGIDKCVPYGFDTYFYIIDKDVRKLFKDEDDKLKMWIASRPERIEYNNSFNIFTKS